MSEPHQFERGQRVRPSAFGIERRIFRKEKVNQSGVVQKLSHSFFPVVLWDGRVSTSTYHPDFLEPDFRQEEPKP